MVTGVEQRPAARRGKAASLDGEDVDGAGVRHHVSSKAGSRLVDDGLQPKRAGGAATGSVESFDDRATLDDDRYQAPRFRLVSGCCKLPGRDGAYAHDLDDAAARGGRRGDQAH